MIVIQREISIRAGFGLVSAKSRLAVRRHYKWGQTIIASEWSASKGDTEAADSS